MNKYHLGINLGHDRSAALVKDGAVIAAIHQERLDRCKHSVGFLAQSGADARQVELPFEAINYCLETAGINWDDVATVTANLPGVDYSVDILHRKLPRSLHHKIRRIPSHHLAHAYTAYWPSGFNQAIVLITDASGSTDADNLTESYSIYTADEGELSCLHSEKVKSHLADLSTLGFVYEYVTRKADFVTRLNGGISVPEAGKLMGLAPYGGEQIHWNRWLRTRPDSYSVRMSAYDIFLEIAALEKRYDNGRGKAYLRPYLVDLAYKVQHELEQALLHIVATALKETNIPRLCMAGGVALNSVANYLLLRQLQLDDIFTYPAAGDAGIAAGCALWAYATQEAGRNRVAMKTADLGYAYQRSDIESAIAKNANRLDVEELSDSELILKTSKALTRGHIVARVDGGSEYGPRALGQRTILADPTFEKMRDIINARVKFREPFRPFAPVIPEEKVSEVFEQEIASPFMLLISPIHKDYQKKIPSVTHHDGTGRLQTVTAKDNPFLHALCHQISNERKGPPVVLNTSFNVAGQPIVETPGEAIETFLNTDIDYLCIGNFWMSRKNHAVLNYQAHLKKVNDINLPEGLESGQPGVEELMKKLDRALFYGERDQCPWSEEELKGLSGFGARFKETSILFPESPLSNNFTSKFTDNALLLLDPLGESIVMDIRDQRVIGSYSLQDVQLLVAIYSNDTRCLSKLRRELQLTNLEWDVRCDWARKELTLIGVKNEEIGFAEYSVHDTPLYSSGGTLTAFSDPSFSLRSQLKSLNRALQEASYDEKMISERLEVESLQQIEPTHLHYFNHYKLDNTILDDLIRLFLLRGTLSEGRVSEIFGESLMDTMLQLGLLLSRHDQVASRIDIFVVDGIFLATDHRFMLLPEDRIEEDPVMYIGLDSLGLALTAPRYSCRNVLDLCTGSGVQALTASRYAEFVTAVDINPRAIRFARFNAQLNGIANIKVIQSNLYSNVGNGQFDIILANPPFVPSPEKDLAFRDGGAKGEDILSKIISEASDHLTEYGRLHIVTDLVEISEYRHKLHTWWNGGPAEKVVLTTADRDEILFAVPHSHHPFGQDFDSYNKELGRWVEHFRAADLKNVNFGYILIHRHPETNADSYHTKVIHSPRTAIHHAVKQYLDQQKLLNSDNIGDLYLHINPDICMRQETRLTGPIVNIELFVPDDPLFTAYRVSKPLLEVIQQIGKRPIQIKTLVDPMLKRSIKELTNKGLLWVSRDTHRHPLQHSTELENKFVDPGQDEAILELSSRTTPTCLTSYMQG